MKRFVIAGLLLLVLSLLSCAVFIGDDDYDHRGHTSDNADTIIIK